MIDYLDLNEVNLYVWEDEKSDLIVDNLVKCVENGDDFPEVLVVRNEGDYFIYHDGNHRAIAHYIAGKPLKVNLVDADEDDITEAVFLPGNLTYGKVISLYKEDYFLVGDTKLVNDADAVVSLDFKIKNDINYKENP